MVSASLTGAAHPMLMIVRSLSFAAVLAAASPALAQQDPHAGHAGHAEPADKPAEEHYGHMGHMEHMDHMHMQGMQMHGDHMTGALGPYAMNREASGTSWQPDAAPHGGVHTMRGDWMFMHHALLNGVFTSQEGPRGDDKAFVSGMLMVSARRDFMGGDTLNLRAMVSPDAFSGKRGYPTLLAAGETADGVTTLTDRQHPHDLFMELSASWAHKLSDTDSVFVYAGLPGEPAFGPPAFMHRLSIMDSPEAPIAHHWLDSTHITFGVLTGGWVHDNWKLEASGFRGREPDQDRYDIESPKLDSGSVRVSWNPTQNWSLQASWADVKSPEQLHPDEDETRWTTSAVYTTPRAAGGWYAATVALGRKERSDGVDLNAGSVEAAMHLATPWTLFARGEIVETDELGGAGVETVSKASLGVIRDFRVHEHAVVGVGALVTKSFVGSALEPSYDGDPAGGAVFVRLKVE